MGQKRGGGVREDPALRCHGNILQLHRRISRGKAPTGLLRAAIQGFVWSEATERSSSQRVAAAPPAAARAGAALLASTAPDRSRAVEISIRASSRVCTSARRWSLREEEPFCELAVVKNLCM